MFMRRVKKKHSVLVGFLAVALVLLLGTGSLSLPVYAANGTVYTCAITPCYQHPVTGVIEDSGGEASYVTGQGMVEGAVYDTGILEVTDTGEYYLTIRMSLMDYTSNHSFWVQNVGDTEWMTPAIGATGNGTDNNGTTTDICIQVPSENCVVRASMYVEPMQRDVVFYFYPSNYVEGNTTNMNSTMISADTGNIVCVLDNFETWLDVFWQGNKKNPGFEAGVRGIPRWAHWEMSRENGSGYCPQKRNIYCFGAVVHS